MRRRLKWIAIACGVAIVLPANASAQSWLYAVSQPRDMFGAPSGPVTLTEVMVGPNGPTSVTRQIRIPGTLHGDPVVTYDGRFVAWRMALAGSNSASIAVLDRRTGATTSIPGIASNGVLRADPTALRLFFLAADATGYVTSITIVEPGGLRQVPVAPIRSVGPISADGRDLFVVRQSVVDTIVTYRIDAINPITGETRRQLPPFEPFAEPAGLTASRDGLRLYMTVSSPATVRVLDASTGAEFVRRTIPLTIGASESIGAIRLDDRHQRVFVTRHFLSGSAGGGGSSVVLDAQTLQDVSTGAAMQYVVDRSQGLVVGTGSFFSRFSGCGSAVVETWDARSTPASTMTVPLDGGCLSLAIATPPDAPTTISHAVTGGRVTIAWSTVPGAVDYQLEAGTATGLSNLAQLRVGTTPSFSVDNVPSGTYYVRVRAINEVGVGMPSADLRIVVP